VKALSPFLIGIAVPLLIVILFLAAGILRARFGPRSASAPPHARKLLETEDTGDPIEDTERRMVYGWYEDAATVIRRGIQNEPSRIDLKAKLFEVLFVWGEADQFRQAGQDYKPALHGKLEWDAICTMATQICPDDRTFR
jgi:hypothetical protein